MKIWITGSKGLVGTALQKKCPSIATSRAEVDITSLDLVERFVQTHEVTHIINCAAYTNVDQAEKEPALAHQVNALGPENLGTVAKKNNLKLLHLSTDYVFGDTKNTPFSETDPCNPLSVYAKTKYEGEHRLLSLFPEACVLRTSWVFGPGGKNFISVLLKKIQQEEKIFVVADQKNRLTYVHDLADTILSLLPHSGIFHFANQGAISRFDIAKEIAHSKEIIPVLSSAFPQAAKRPLYSVLDTTKIEKLGIHPRPWQHALKEFFHAV